MLPPEVRAALADGGRLASGVPELTRERISESTRPHRNRPAHPGIHRVEEARESAGGEVEAVGFGIPALLDQRIGRAVFSVHLPLADVPFGDIMAERLGLPVFVDNDSNLAALAEHRAGAARGCQEAVVL